MDDFIFGTLATDALRLEHQRKVRGGVTHRNQRTPLDPQPAQPITLEITVGPAHACDRAWVYWATVNGNAPGLDPSGAGGEATVGTATPMEMVGVEWDVLLWGYVRRYRAVLPGQLAGTLLRYRFGISGPEQSESASRNEVWADGGAFYAVYIDDDPTPAWATDAVIYQIFVDRFSPGPERPWLQPETPAGFYGGRLEGVTQQLDYIAGLGANVLWLTPIFPSPSHHGYDATDLMSIEPRLGTPEDLRRLLDAAHARGMRVLLDFVPNHWSSLHASFQAALADPASPYVDWYNFRRWPDDYETFFGVQSLPQLNLRFPGARQHMLEAAAHWLQFGVDGYRVDYAIGPAFDFWADFRRTTRRARPDCWTFGEVVEPSDSQVAFSGLLDGCLDFILLEALRQTFGFGRWDAGRFADFLSRHEAFFPPDFSRPSFLDNHDMNRFLWSAGSDKRRLKLAALCQFTLSGAPVIYYGTEVGLSQVRDVRQGAFGLPEESRLPMLWGAEQDRGLLDFYLRLIQLRRSEPALTRGQRRTLLAEGERLVYTRSDVGHSLAVVLNLGTSSQKLRLPSAWSQIALATDPACRLSAGEVHLPPLAGVVLKQ